MHFSLGESIAVSYVVCVCHCCAEFGSVGREIGIPDPIVEPVAWVEVAVGAGDGVAVGVLGSVVYFSLDLRCMNWMLEEM